MSERPFRAAITVEAPERQSPAEVSYRRQRTRAGRRGHCGDGLTVGPLVQ